MQVTANKELPYTGTYWISVNNPPYSHKVSHNLIQNQVKLISSIWKQGKILEITSQPLDATRKTPKI